jgi:3-oxoacyl-[acyl-carrier protein] reductase
VSPVRAARVLAFLAGPRASFLTALRLRVNREPKAAPGRRLDGKVAVLTGAARGIGAATALALAREGAAVGLNDLPDAEGAAARTLAALRELGARAAFLPFDISTAEGAEGLTRAVEAEFGGLDILVNNAGVTRDKTIKRMDLARWRAAVEVNLGSQIRLTEALRRLLREEGAIVNLSSVAGIAGNFGQTNYSAAKAGVLGWTRLLARELAGRGITVNAVAPGYIETRMTRAMPLINRQMAKQLTALLQPGQPRDVADLIAFLVGPDGAAITGQVLRADGCMAMGA